MEGNQTQPTQDWFNVITQITLDYQKRSKELSEVPSVDNIETDVVFLLQSKKESLSAKKENMRF